LNQLCRADGGEAVGGLAASVMSDTTVLSTVWMSPPSVPAEWRLVAIADVDRNGTTDLAWQHPTHGPLAVWYMSGLSMSVVGSLAHSLVPLADCPYWRVVGVK
jgi:hypothetical protein